jgi:hypothetical protein
MATITETITTTASASAVWDVLRDVGAVHTRLAPGFVVDTAVEPGERARVVTFANGLVARELIVGVSDAERRLAYAVVDSDRLTYHHGVFTVDGSTLTWQADVLPDEMAPLIGDMMRAGMAVMKETFDSA